MAAVEALAVERSQPDRGTVVAADRAFAWRVLRLLNVVRVTVSVLLLAVFLLVDEPLIAGVADAPLALIALLAWLAAGAAVAILLRRGPANATAQAFVQFAVDLGGVTLLMHASGGIASGLGGILVVSIGSLSLLLTSERAYLLAALATFTLLAEQTFAQLQGLTTGAAYVPAGVLGAVIFVITAVMQGIRRRIIETEALAEQRGVDLRNLVELNDYIIQHLRESIVVVDGDDRVRLINESAVKLLGSTHPAGSELAIAAPELARNLRTWRAGTGGRDAGAPFGSADGSTTIQPHFAPLGRGRLAGVLIFLEDTTLLAERVQQAKLAALGRLSASIAHEIRNPLGAMSHAGQLLAESPGIGADSQRLTDIIRVNSRRVSQIVESVLALSKRDKTEPKLLELDPWLKEFAREFVATLELFEGAVTVIGNADVEAHIDPTHLHQILWNLCDNAVKYASAAAGAIAVEISCGYLESSGRAFVEVGDRGPGIDREHVEEIFEPFYTGQPGGTGLGLFISRELAERNGAALRYHSRPGGGALFRVVFADPDRWHHGEDGYAASQAS